MTTGFDKLPANRRALVPVARDELHSRFGWLAAQFERADLEAFAARLLHIPLPAHTPLIARDASSCSLYLVAEGELSVSVALCSRFDPARERTLADPPVAWRRDDGSDGGTGPDAVTVGYIGAGGWIGESGLLNLEPLGYSVTVARDSWLLVLTASQFERLARERVAAASTLLQVLSLSIVDRFRACQRRRAERMAAPTSDSAGRASLASLAMLLGV